MKRTANIILGGLLAASLLSACTDETPNAGDAAAVDRQAPPTVRGVQGRAGTVVETMNAGGYTYVKVDTGVEVFWAAAPAFVVQVGDPVVVPEGMPMPQYHSNTLDRDFDVLYFVDAVQVEGTLPAAAPAAELPAGHPPVGTQERGGAGGIDVAGIEQADGGQRIGEVIARRADFAGQAVTVRGRVVKFNAGIMGKNWLHVQDGTGEPGRNDLTVTTDATVKVGDTVVLTGVVAIDKDLGFGYTYEVLLEDAAVTVE